MAVSPVKLEFVGKDALVNRIQGLKSAMAEDILTDALTDAKDIIVPLAQSLAPKKTGTYSRSIDGTISQISAGRSELRIGSPLPYGNRLEFGFNGVDSLGRRYNQAARPHLRPAVDQTRSQTTQAIRDRIQARVAEILGSRR